LLIYPCSSDLIRVQIQILLSVLGDFAVKGCLPMQKNDIAAYAVVERLRDDRQVTIRAIRPDDRGRVAEALRNVGPESFYRRTFSPKRELSHDDLKQLTEVDFEIVVALVAVMTEEGRDRIVGAGRYIRMGDAAAPGAEVAFLIDDEHQSLGIGSRIFKHLVAIARASGIGQFEAEVLPSNEGMLRLFDRSGLPVARTASREAVHVTIELATTGKPVQDRSAAPGGAR
jgi:GNAT superfamily N-acetyltransferase